MRKIVSSLLLGGNGRRPQSKLDGAESFDQDHRPAALWFSQIPSGGDELQNLTFREALLRINSFFAPFWATQIGFSFTRRHTAPVRRGWLVFRRRVARIDDGDRRLVESRRSVPDLAVAPPSVPANPYPARGVDWIRDSTPRTTSHADVARLR